MASGAEGGGEDPAGDQGQDLSGVGVRKIPLQTHELEVPRYEEPATLWVQILDGGKLAAVISRYDPPNANWPGAVRGGRGLR